MATSYEKPDATTMRLLQEIKHQQHHCLASAEVGIGILMAKHDNDEADGPVLSLHGRPCEAIVRISPLRARALGAPDAVIEIDAAAWEDLTADQRRALLDHELEHLQVQRSDGTGVLIYDAEAARVIGETKVDTLGRPKLRMRQHDYELAGFKSIILRHRDNAPEVRQIKSVMNERGQYAWDFGQ